MGMGGGGGRGGRAGCHTFNLFLHLLKPAHPNDNAFNPICIKQHDDENMPIKNQSDNDSAASISSH